MHAHEEQVLAPAFISVGAGIMSIYLANYLQKSTSTPRKNWTRMIASCNADLVAYLLKLNGREIKAESRGSYNREFRAYISEKMPTTIENVIRLEILLHKRKINPLLDMSPGQLRQIKVQLEEIYGGVEDLSKNYDRPITNREFSKDFADMQSKLRLAIKALDLLDSRSSANIAITDKKPKLLKALGVHSTSLGRPEVTVFVHPLWRARAKANPDAFWATIRFLDYLRSLIYLTNTYGHSNNSTLSLLIGRKLYVSHRWGSNKTP